MCYLMECLIFDEPVIWKFILAQCRCLDAGTEGVDMAIPSPIIEATVTGSSKKEECKRALYWPYELLNKIGPR